MSEYFPVYVYATYDENTHISLASLAGMQESTGITSSLSKTCSVTGDLLGLGLSVRREMTINI